MAKLSRSHWQNTPYARSEARNPDASVQNLLTKYKVEDIQWTTGKGPTGRPAVQLRFVLNERGYCVTLESLDADASRDELLIQIKRAIFFYLKSILEVTAVFFSVEEALFAHLELPQGQTMFSAARPHLDKLTGPNFGQLMLPAKGE